MSPIETFTNFLSDRDFAVQDLETLSEVIEEVNEAGGMQGYRLKRTKAGDTVSREKVRYRCNVLMLHTWHSRDYVKKILLKDCNKDVEEIGKLLNSHIGNSRDLQIISYLANAYKHAGVNYIQKWATDLEPQYGGIYVFGFMERFPARMKPTIMFTKENEVQFELTGFAQIGDDKYPFADFDWTISCVVEDKNGNILGDAISICERGFQTWIHVLRESGIELEVDGRLRPNADSLLLSLNAVDKT